MARQRYAVGGLAALTGADPDEQDDPSLVQAPGALEEATGTGERQPANLPTQSTKAGQKMTNTDAMKRLEDARQNLINRRDSIESNKRDEWLALAQGMLAPTRTGGFAESVGSAAGLVGAVRTEKRDALTDIEKDLLDSETKQQQIALNSRARLGSRSTVYHPDDVAEYPDNPEEWRQIEKQTIVHNDGTTEHIFTGTDDGELLQVVSTQNPITVRERGEADVAGKAAQKLIMHDIEQGLTATLAQGKLRKARDLFAQVETSGLKSMIASVGDYLNIDIADNADLRMVRNLIGKEVLTQLQSLTGTKTDFEYKKIESLNASTEASQEANLRIIDEMMSRYDRIIEIGERSALAAAQNPDDDLQVLRYREYREAEAARKEMETMQEESQVRPPDPAFDTRLIDTWSPGGDNTQLIEAYKRRGFQWPPSDPNVISELRKKGADI